MSALAALVAHGGAVGGAIEAGIGVAVVIVFGVLIWRMSRGKAERPDSEPGEPNRSPGPDE